MGSKQVGLEQVGSKQVGLEQVGSKQVGLEQVGSKQGLVQVGSEQGMGSGQVGQQALLLLELLLPQGFQHQMLSHQMKPTMNPMHPRRRLFGPFLEKPWLMWSDI